MTDFGSAINLTQRAAGSRPTEIEQVDQAGCIAGMKQLGKFDYNAYVSIGYFLATLINSILQANGGMS